jgi:hypothetical protein
MNMQNIEHIEPKAWARPEVKQVTVVTEALSLISSG